MKQLIFKILFLCNFMLFAQQNCIEIRLLDAQTKLAIESAIIKIDANQFLVSDSAGKAKICNIKSKILIVSHISYQVDTINIDTLKHSNATVYLKNKNTKLNEVQIIGLEKREIPTYKYEYPLNTKPATIANPISFFYEKFSRKIKEVKKYQKTIQNEALLSKIKNRIIKNNSFLNVKFEDLDELAYLMHKKTLFILELSDLEFLTDAKQIYTEMKK